jgi:hypothetical protein
MSWLTDIARPEIRALKAYEHALGTGPRTAACE